MRNLLLFITFLVGGCVSIQTSVTAFHELPDSLAGVTFSIVPSKEQEGSLEFKNYANLVKSELKQQGMVEAPFNEAKYAIFMSYGIDNGRQIVLSYPVFGQTGSSYSYTSGTITSTGNNSTYSGITSNAPSYGVVGSGMSSDTIYTRFLYIDIIDIAQSRNGKIHKVYEGRAISSGASNELAIVMPTIVKSIFVDFPGESGKTKKIVLHPEK